MPEFLETTVDKFTFRVATDRLYARDGLWILSIPGDPSSTVRVGLSDYLQMHSGDAAFVTPKPIGTRLEVNDDFAELETMKINVALPSPVSGTIVAVNEALEEHPELVNQSPYENGWLAEINAANWESERSSLLEAKAYLEVMLSLVQEELKKQ